MSFGESSGLTPPFTAAVARARTAGTALAAPERIRLAGGTLLIVIGVVALAGWFLDARALTAVRSGYIPVAPNTALLFLLLGAALWTLERPGRAMLAITRAAIAVSLIVAGSRFIEYMTGIDLQVDRWMFAFPAENLGLAPVGRMAFFTAMLFVLAAGTLFAQTLVARPVWMDDLARALALLVTLAGLLFLLGYAYGSPLLYGRTTIPMALLTAAGFTAMGLSVIVPAALRRRAEQQGAQRALRAAHDELERRVAERTTELAASNEELRAMVLELEEQTVEAELARDEARVAADALRESEERHRVLFERNPLPMWVFDVESLRILSVNGAAVSHYGYGREEFLRMTVADLRFPEDVPQLMASRSSAGSGRNEAGIHRHRRKDGSAISVDIVSDDAWTGGRPARVVLAHDISERVALEAQLRQAQKMEAVGQLAGGIAHDFNNMLTAIKSFSELLMAEMPTESPHRSDVVEIRNAADRAAALTRQLLAFSRRQLLQPVALDLNDIVRNLEDMLGRLLGEDVECVWKLDERLGLAVADPGQIEQIVMNLAVNARDAMPTGGRLTIQTTNTIVDDAYAERVGDMAPGPYVVLAVSDTGTGMDAATQARIFEPFFTTKDPGKGTGLGLSTVYGIVKQSAGHITVYSEAGRGTTFRVYLPRAQGEASHKAPTKEPPVALPRGDETILLVEDDPAVRLVAARILGRQGYRVLEAPAPAEAEAIVARLPGAIDLMMTDLVLPGISGRELAERLCVAEPRMRVLFMSGYTDDAVIRRGLLEPGMAFLGKPFTVEEVARKVRSTLDQ